jgi:myo-inositol-1(or 4)-monophosphatase
MDIEAGKLLKKIIRTVAPADAIALEYFGKATASMKEDKTYVTEADKSIEKLLRAKLPRLIAGSVAIGEETVIDAAAALEASKKEWVWVIDPIDGTSSFIDGIPTFCISVGLLRSGKPYAGVLRFPVTGDMYSAARGAGAFYNGQRLKISASTPLRFEAPLCTTSKSHLHFTISYPGRTRDVGSLASHVAQVSRGIAIGALCTGHIWDYVGTAAILLEAGGELRYIDGKPINWGAVVAERGFLPMPVLATARGRWKEIAAYIQLRKEIKNKKYFNDD